MPRSPRRKTRPRSPTSRQPPAPPAKTAATTPAPAPPPGAPAPPPMVIPTPPTQASAVVLADSTRRVHDALQSYFSGEFEDATKKFRTLAQDLPNNGYIWAFLGASQYSQYAFEADDRYKDDALQSFHKAKSLRKWNGGLPPKYFSRRIRKVFDSAS